MSRLTGFIMLLLVFSGCGGVDTKKSSLGNLLKEELVSKSRASIPKWMNVLPEDEKKLWFVGFSTKNTTEQNGRDNAYNHAVKEVAKFIGVDVFNKVSVIQKSSAKSSAIFDPTETRKSIQEFLTKAMVSKVKGKEYYVEKWKGIYTGGVLYYYKVRVLSHVSKEAIQQVIRNRSVYQQKVNKTVARATDSLIIAEKFVNQASRQSSLKPSKALSNLNKALQAVNLVKALILPYPEIRSVAFLKQAKDIKQKIINIEGLISKNPAIKLRLSLSKLIKSGVKMPFRIAIGSITYRDTSIATEFSQHLTRKLEQVLSSENSKQQIVISNEDLRKILKQKKISLESILKNPRLLGYRKKLDGMLYVKFFEEQGEIRVVLELKKSPSAELLKSDSLRLPREMFSSCRTFFPKKNDVDDMNMLIDKQKKKSKMQIKIWTDRGKGAEYKKGENVRFFLKSNRDCYVYIWVRDSKGVVNLLFPNPSDTQNYIKANITHTIPSPSMGLFAFPIQAPFGTDIITVKASTSPLADIKMGESFSSINMLVKSRGYKSRGIGYKGIGYKVLQAKATCSVRTVK